MIQFTKFSLKNRAGILIMVLILSALGVSAGLGLPMEFLPSLDNPMVTVTTFAPTLDAKSMSKEVTVPLEKQFKNIKHVDYVSSATSQGLTTINIHFSFKANMKEVTQEVERIVGQTPLPAGVMKPFVAQLNTDMIPIAQMAVKYNQDITLENESFLQNEIVPQFEGIDGISIVSVFGGSKTEIQLELDQQKMLDHQISLLHIMSALQGKDVTIPAGELSLDGKKNTLRVIGELNTIADINNLVLLPGVTLSDIADVSLHQAMEAYTHFGGQEALGLIITKEAGANSVEVGDRIQEKVKSINEQYKDRLSIDVFSITSEEVKNAVIGMGKEVALGALFAAIVILMFLRNIRATIIAVVSIPLSILLTFFLLQQAGITLNILTLGGLAVAVGRLVDDSIVVIENIYRRLKLEKLSQELIIDSTKEVAVAITSSTLTTVAVFLPIGFVQGFIGEFFLSFALTVSFSLLSSLLVALTVVPLLSLVLFKKAKQETIKIPKMYVNTLKWSLSHKWVVLLLSFILFVGSMAAFAVIPAAPLNSDDVSSVSITMTYPADTDRSLVIEGATRLEKYALENKDVKDTLFRVGSSQEDARYGQVTPGNIATMFILIEKGGDTEAFIENVKGLKEDFLPADIEIGVASFAGVGGSGLNLLVTSEKAEDLIPTYEQVLTELKKIDGLDKIESNYEETKNEWAINVDLEKAQNVGLTPEQVGQQVGAITGRTPIGSITMNEESVPILVQYDLQHVKNKNDLLNMYVMSPIIGPVKLAEIATLTEQPAQATIYHRDGKEYIQINAEITAQDTNKVDKDINDMIEDLNLPAGVNVSLGGVTEEMQKQFAELFKTMAVAIGIVYLVMVITFGQARAPFAILFSLPLAAIGAILGLVITQTPVDITSLIGALMLIGIVVTNAIVLLDRVHQKKAEGLDTREALLEAGATRLRPILMTAIATICAMLPLLFSQTEGGLVSKSLAVVVIGGLSVSTLLTLIVVPVIYELLDRIGKKKREKKIKDESSNIPNLV